VLSGRGLCNGLITPPEEYYRLLCVVCDVKSSEIRRQLSALDCGAIEKRYFDKIRGEALFTYRVVVSISIVPAVV
jgi:hypothetical protein